MVDIGTFAPLSSEAEQKVDIPQIQNVHKPGEVPEKEAPVVEYKFEEIDLEDCVLSMVKRGNQFTKVYKVWEDVDIEVRELSNKDRKKLNAIQQEISCRGDRRKNRVYFSDPNDNNSRLGHEAEVYFNTDSIRSMRVSELSMYIKSINKEDLPNSQAERVEFLEDFSDTFLDYVYFYVLNHFKALVVEATKKFHVF